jgi:hypothetical protein
MLGFFFKLCKDETQAKKTQTLTKDKKEAAYDKNQSYKMNLIVKS